MTNGEDMNDLETGKLIAAVEQLSERVKDLSEKVDTLESQMDKGKGVLFGVFLIAGALGAAGSTVVHKLIGFFGG